MRKSFLPLFLCFYFVLVTRSATAGGYSIYYSPIGVDTFVAVTVDTIPKYYTRYCHCDMSDKKYRRLLLLLSKMVPGSFDPLKVRAKIKINDSQWVYIDDRGGVNSASGSYKIDKESLVKVRKLLGDMTVPRTRSY